MLAMRSGSVGVNACYSDDGSGASNLIVTTSPTFKSPNHTDGGVTPNSVMLILVWPTPRTPPDDSTSSISNLIDLVTP